MKRTLQVLNDLEAGSILTRYAIGGAMGATFYMEPTLTFALEVLVVLPRTSGGLHSMAGLYENLRRCGYSEEGEHAIIAGMPVQFLPAYNPLLEEALTEAREMFYENVPTRVLRSEHLIAICLHTGRGKDRERVGTLCSQAKLDMEYLEAVISRHQLREQWNQWRP